MARSTVLGRVRVQGAPTVPAEPNDWSDDPQYVVNLLKRIVTVSLATVETVKHLPPLDIVEDAA